MYQYFAGAAVAAMMASTAVAATSAPGYYGNGFSYDSSKPSDGSLFGPAAVFETVTFDRGGKGFFFISFDVNNSNTQAVGTYDFAGFSALTPATDEVPLYIGGGEVPTAPEGAAFRTVESGQETTEIKSLAITFGNYGECASQSVVDSVASCDVPDVGVSIQEVKLSAVPLPASVLLLGAGIAGLGAMRRRQKKA